MTAHCRSDSGLSFAKGRGEGVDTGPAGWDSSGVARCDTETLHALPRGATVKIKPLKPLADDAIIRVPENIEWDCGTFFCYWGRFRVFIRGAGVFVAKLRPFPRPPEWVEQFRPVVTRRMLMCGDRKMASKWIKAAVAKRSKVKPGALPMDAALGLSRPALTDFMTELEAEPGRAREPSALMIVCTPDGVRAGLKDDDAGGWCWREGGTLAAALDAIEAALQAGEGAFRGPRVAKKKSR